MGAQRSLLGVNQRDLCCGLVRFDGILSADLGQPGCVEVGDEGHDDGSDSRVKAAVVTRCLSPLGTGNDETGSDWLSGSDSGCSIEPLVAHWSPSLVEIVWLPL